MTDPVLQKSYKTQWLITLSVLGVATLAVAVLLIKFWEDITSIGPLYDLIKIIVILVPLLLGVAYLTFAERKIIGYMQVRIGPNRVGPRGWLQPIADALKLLMKEVILPTKADRAELLLLATASLLMRAGERFTLLGSGAPPATGRRAYDRLADPMTRMGADVVARLPLLGDEVVLAQRSIDGTCRL